MLCCRKIGEDLQQCRTLLENPFSKEFRTSTAFSSFLRCQIPWLFLAGNCAESPYCGCPFEGGQWGRFGKSQSARAVKLLGLGSVASLDHLVTCHMGRVLECQQNQEQKLLDHLAVCHFGFWGSFPLIISGWGCAWSAPGGREALSPRSCFIKGTKSGSSNALCLILVASLILARQNSVPKQQR